jgi:hypothetical protein
MQFRITPHSVFDPPENAMDLLWQRLGPRRDEMSFAKVGAGITVRADEDAPVAMTRDERVEIGRRAVLDVVSDVCEGSPELNSDWFAISSGF